MEPLRVKEEGDRKLRLARESFRRYKALCFWDFPDNFEITAETIPLIVRRLRSEGNRGTYRIAAELCR
ncbi:MAG: hypothetical protein ACLQAT_28085 [Candidatus Binataceae bacterium]